MKILFLVSLFPSVSETFVLNQITGLIDRGQQVDILASAPERGTAVHPDIATYHLLDRTRYVDNASIRVPKKTIERVSLGLSRALTRFHRNPRAVLKSFDVRTFGRAALSCRIFLRIEPFLNLGKYDAMVCHFGTNGEFGAVLKASRVFRGKLVTVFHGYDMTRHLKEKGEHVYDFLFTQGDLFLPISDRWRQELIRLGCDERKIQVHHMGIDAAAYRCGEGMRSEDGSVKILSVARLVEKKGLAYGIQAVARLVIRHPATRYIIVGDGPMRNEIEGLVRELGLESNVALVGWKAQDEIIRIMEESDILLAPSVTSADGDQEGIPVVLMEAMAMGLPVVSTFHSGIPELVQDGISGFLVQERDPEALAARLERLVSQRAERIAMGEAGRDVVRRDYNIARLNDRLVEMLNLRCPPETRCRDVTWPGGKSGRTTTR